MSKNTFSNYTKQENTQHCQSILQLTLLKSYDGSFFFDAAIHIASNSKSKKKKNKLHQMYDGLCVCHVIDFHKTLSHCVVSSENTNFEWLVWVLELCVVVCVWVSVGGCFGVVCGVVCVLVCVVVYCGGVFAVLCAFVFVVYCCVWCVLCVVCVVCMLCCVRVCGYVCGCE